MKAISLASSLAVVAAILLPATVHSEDAGSPPGPVAGAAAPPGKKVARKLKPDPDAVTARVRARGEHWDLRANALGGFPRVVVAAKAPVKVDLRLPESLAGEFALIALRGGGTLDHGFKQVRARVGPRGRLAFTYFFGVVEHFQYVEVRVGKRKLQFDFHVDH